MEIQRIALVTDESPSEFERKLEKAISTMQNEGLQVTVQFSTSTIKKGYSHYINYSALVIGQGIPKTYWRASKIII